jgi:hypothetical protein
MMGGADPVVVDTFLGEYRARDFYMNKRSQCSTAPRVVSVVSIRTEVVPSTTLAK